MLVNQSPTLPLGFSPCHCSAGGAPCTELLKLCLEAGAIPKSASTHSLNLSGCISRMGPTSAPFACPWTRTQEALLSTGPYLKKSCKDFGVA